MEAIPTNLQRYVDPCDDIIGAAALCEEMSATALETHSLAEQREIYQHLNMCLSKLLPVLNDPIALKDRARFIVDSLPPAVPTMDSESDLLCEYCLALSELLTERRMSMQTEETLQGLLYDLTRYLTDIISAPRWLRTPTGLEPIL